MRIQWEVDDGYVGKSRPHFLTIPDDELDGLSETDQNEIIEGYVQSDFENKVAFYWKRV
jgi:hypothetical protein